MPALPRLLMRLAAGMSVALVLLGCRTVHEVRIDAISDPSQPIGRLSRLQVRPGQLTDDAVLQQVVAHVEHALQVNGIGLAAAGVKPDLIIHVEAGVGPGQRKFVYDATVEPQYRVGRKDRKLIIVYEKFIRLSARAPETSSGPRGRDVERSQPEVWSVNVGIEDESLVLEPYLPALTAALIDHIGDNAPGEVTVRIPETEAQRAVGLSPKS